MLEKYNFEVIDNKVNKDLKRALCQTLEMDDTKISYKYMVLYVCATFMDKPGRPIS